MSEDLPPEGPKPALERGKFSQAWEEIQNEQRGTTHQARKLLNGEARRRREREQEENVEIVNNLKLERLTPAHIEKAGEAYMKAWLTEETLRLLIDRKDPEFMRQTERGVFVFRFEEKQRGAHLIEGQKKSGALEKEPFISPSVKEQMFDDLQRAESKDFSLGEFRGYSLVDEQSKEIKAWATFLLPPTEQRLTTPDSPYFERIKKMLERGASGGTMKYDIPSDQERFINEIPSILNNDTIISNVRYGAHRLYAEAMKDMEPEMTGEMRNIKYALLYRLKSLKLLLPSGKERKTDDLIPHASNISSEKFFIDRGCRSIADDNNPAGPKSKRVVDGKKYGVRPRWLWLAGRTLDIHTRSQNIWNYIQGKEELSQLIEKPSEPRAD